MQVPWLASLPVLTWLGWPAATAWGWRIKTSLGYVGQVRAFHTALVFLLRLRAQSPGHPEQPCILAVYFSLRCFAPPHCPV